VTILDFGASSGLGAAWLAGPGQGGACVTDQAEVARYREAFGALAAVALSPAESARLLRQREPAT
jgi:hypothetical protein